MQIEPYRREHRDAVIQLSVRAWTPVFAALRSAVPDYVYDSFWPQGWEVRQRSDVAAILDTDPETVYVAVDGPVVLGWMAVRLHPVDDMGEVAILAVDPAHQRRGTARALLDHACDIVRAAGMRMVMVETGDDPGHAASRATYEAVGFDRWPVARYFKDLAEEAEGAQSSKASGGGQEQTRLRSP
ncbi:MAG: GNAT family N-acetyltransferase [Actinomycetales bacterium]|nr:GNAT family N-acetyltransferase [Actinomycetales bacterium]